MWNVISSILGGGGVVEQGMKLIDDAWETDAEKTEARAKAKIDLMKAYAPFKIAQRYLALMFTTVYLASYISVIIMTLSGAGQPDDITKVMDQFSINWIMGAIVGFYFSGGLVESFGRSRKKSGE